MIAVAIPVALVPAAAQLRLAAGRRVLPGPRRLVLRGRRHLRLALGDAGGAGGGARRLRPRQRRALGGGLPRAAPRRRRRAARGLPHLAPRCSWSGASPSRSLARDAPARTPPGSFAAAMSVLGRERLAWALAAFYFLTFGGFVAFSIYLPDAAPRHLRPLRRRRGLPHRRLRRPRHRDAAGRADGWPTASAARACCAACSTAWRPFALLLAWPSMLPVHGGRARLRRAPRPRQRRRLQARAAVLPGRHRHRHRPRGRDGRPRRLLPAAAARRLPRPAGRGVAGVRAAGADRGRPRAA